ncbi:MAG: hypothetical protein ACKO66_07585, partial [Flavobacteriales bacterium]
MPWTTAAEVSSQLDSIARIIGSLMAFSEAIMAMGLEEMKYYFETNKYSTIESFVVNNDSLASFTGAFPEMWNRAEQVMKKP